MLNFSHKFFILKSKCVVSLYMSHGDFTGVQGTTLLRKISDHGAGYVVCNHVVITEDMLTSRPYNDMTVNGHDE